MFPRRSELLSRTKTGSPMDLTEYREMLHNALRSAQMTHSGQVLLTYARRAAGSRHIDQLFYDLYTRLITPTELYNNEERMFLISLLHAIADGKDVASALRIDRAKIGHRRKTQLPAVVLDVVDALLTESLQMTKESAMQEVADVLEMELGAVQEAYKEGRRRIQARETAAKRVKKKS